MAVIVLHKNTNKKYIVLGTGFGAYKAITPSFFGGNLFPHEEEGTIQTAAVCNSKGEIIWFNSDDLQVIEIDGVEISQINLFVEDRSIENSSEEEKALNHYEICPVCGTKADEIEQYCIGCGFKVKD